MYSSCEISLNYALRIYMLCVYVTLQQKMSEELKYLLKTCSLEVFFFFLDHLSRKQTEVCVCVCVCVLYFVNHKVLARRR